MKMSRRTFLTAAVCVLVLLALSACADPNLAVEDYAMIVSESDINQLEMFPNLKTVDLRGSTCYDAILEYSRSHPQVTVRYNVVLGNTKADSTETEITVEASQVTFEELRAKLPYLPNLQKLTLSDAAFTPGQLEELRSAFPKLTIEYSIRFFGSEYPSNSTHVNLSAMTPDSIPAVIERLQMLPDITYAELMTPVGSTSLSISDVKQLQEAFPSIRFHYTFELFGKMISTTDEKVSYADMPLGIESEAEIRAALDILKGCREFILDDCGLDTATMANLRRDYPDTKIVWRMYFGRYSILTNEKTIRMPSGVTNQNADNLKYCTDVENLDLSFNKTLTNYDFLRSMPKLKILVLNYTPVQDLRVLENCPELEWLELVLCSKLSDLTPLAGHTNLKYLNISGTVVKKLDALASLPLERFMCVKNQTSESEETSFAAAHPNCAVRFTGANPLGVGWHFDSGSDEPIAYYARMIELFRYGEKGYTGNRK